MKSHRSSSSSSSNGNSRCDGTYSSRSGGAGISIFGIGGIGASGGSSSGRQKCTSLFNTASRRSASDLQISSTDTTLDKTSVEKAGLSNWEVITSVLK